MRTYLQQLELVNQPPLFLKCSSSFPLPGACAHGMSLLITPTTLPFTLCLQTPLVLLSQFKCFFLQEVFPVALADQVSLVYTLRSTLPFTVPVAIVIGVICS